MSKQKTQKTSNTIVVIGLIVQAIFFGLFLTTSPLFHTRLQKNPAVKSITVTGTKYMCSLYFASILITISSMFYAAEFTSSYNSALIALEICLDIFDTVLMFGTGVRFGAVHTGDLIGGRRKSHQDPLPLAKGVRCHD
ncbi:RTA-like protein [Tricladium varicosporioides]|nr:RTA-like protein [Hymenoscyphus varicosporioides]